MIEVDAVARTLELARAEFTPLAADRARARAALGLPAKPSAEVGSRRLEPANCWSALRASGTVGILVGASLVAGGFGVGYWTALQSRERRAAAAPLPILAGERETTPVPTGTAATGKGLDSPPLVPAAPAPHVLPTRAEPALPARAAARAGKRALRPSVATPNAAAPSAAAPVVGDELSLLRRVERALRSDDPALAIALLRELDEHFPNTTLIEERRAATVMAHCGLTDPGARSRAASFLRDWPATVYAERVRAACGVPGVQTTPATLGEGSARRGHE